jgi:hypothetical protein
MKKSIIVCGDSFSVGIGCRDLLNEPYGCLLSKELDIPLINFAKGSSTNLSIYLQAKYVVDKLADKAEIVLVSNTSYDRVNWFPIDYKFTKSEITNADVNYHEYPPYGKDSYLQLLEHPMKDDLEYNGKMFTENYRGIIDYWENFRSKDKQSGYYHRFINEPKERTRIMYEFAALVHEDKIERLNSIGVLTMAHLLLKRASIKHLILTHEILEYSKFIELENLVNVNWGELSLLYPDDLPSRHTSAIGQKIVFETVLKKIKDNNWVKN